ncbi:sulfotransferase 1 family member D1-like [Glandiceps talaboti]
MADSDAMPENGPHKIDGQYVYKGVLCGGYVNRDLLETPESVEIRDGDVFVITYPKSGTTWTQEIVSLLMNSDNPELARKELLLLRAPFMEFKKQFGLPAYIWIWVLSQTLGRLAGYLPTSLARYIPISPPHLLRGLTGINVMNNLKSPRHIKSHLPVKLLPMQIFNKSKIIYIARNPKDTAVSYYHFYRSTSVHGFYKGPWEEFLQMFMNKQVSFGDWFDHVIGWWKYKDHPNVLYLKYEDMKRDPHKAVRQIAEHIDRPISDDFLNRVVEETSFKSMKGREKKEYTFNRAIIDSKISPFIRKGIVGDWENHFTVAQNEEFELLYKERMKDTDLTFDW